MSMNRIFDVMGMIVVATTVSIIVGSPYSSRVIESFANGFSNALRAAKG